MTTEDDEEQEEQTWLFFKQLEDFFTFGCDSEDDPCPKGFDEPTLVVHHDPFTVQPPKR